jgi:hypothetical protein
MNKTILPGESCRLIYPVKDGTYLILANHTHNKTSNIEKDTALLKPNGYLLLSEGTERPTIAIANAQTEASTHEEHISRQSLLKQIKKQNYDIVFFREEATPFYTALLKLAPKALLNSKKLFQTIIKLDVTIASTMGKLNKFFEGVRKQ